MKKYLFIFLGFLIFGLVAAKLTVFRSLDKGDAGRIEAKPMDLTEEVLVTGRVKSAKDINLGFVKTGRIDSLRVRIGSDVREGTILATLDQSDVVAALRQAEAQVAAEEARLANLEAGTRIEEIAVAEARLESSRASLEDAKNALRDKMSSAFITIDDAIHTKADQMISNPRGNNPQISFSADAQISSDIASLRLSLEGIFSRWQSLVPIETDSSANLLLKTEQIKNNLSLAANFLDKLSLALSQVTQSGNVNATTLSTWKSDVGAARTNIQTAISGLSTAAEKVRSALSDLQVEERSLALSKAGTPQAQIDAQKNVIIQAAAKVSELQASLSNTVLRAPVSGVVSSLDAERGEIAAANSTIVRIVSRNASTIEAYIPETDIGTVSSGNTVVITLDAFPGEMFRGSVAVIDPAETVVDGVVNFKTTIHISTTDQRIKSGMTANLRIQTRTKRGALALPQYAILENDRGKFVRIPEKDGGYTETPIITGIRSPEGYVEIVSGIDAGTEVLNIGIKE